MKEQTMLVECVHGDFSDPEAVSGSSTMIIEKNPLVGDFFVGDMIGATFVVKNNKTG